MLALIRSASLLGIKGYGIIVEVDASPGLPGYCIVGLPDSAIKESRDRVFAALKNSGFLIPNRRITVNLAPADIKKNGSSFDLPIALGILVATEQLPGSGCENLLIIGELSLEGTVKPVRGMLSVAVYAKEAGFAGLVLAAENCREASAMKGLSLYPALSLMQVGDILQAQSKRNFLYHVPPASKEKIRDSLLDFSHVKGQETAKRALEIAAAGAHNFLLVGSPGCGKSLLSRRLPGILPAMSLEESLTTTMIHSAAGLIGPEDGLLSDRPFRSPHHTISNMALVGGGAYPKPGEVSLAHNGVLFLDELPEFQKAVLEVLRQPLEDGIATIARAAMTLAFPCQCMLGAAMNPCPCGYLMDPKRNCACRELEIRRYRSKISGPLMDRIDIQLEMPTLNYDELSSTRPAEASLSVLQRVETARRLQWKRFEDQSHVFCNGHMGPREISRYCKLGEEEKQLLKEAVLKLGLSARAYDRILRVGRTIADLDGQDRIKTESLAEAIHYRCLDRNLG